MEMCEKSEQEKLCNARLWWVVEDEAELRCLSSYFSPHQKV